MPFSTSRFTRRSLRRSIVAAVAATFVAVPASALAAGPIASFHDHFTDSFSGQICGIDVDGTATVTNNFSLLADWSVRGTGSTRTILTNPLNGKSVVLSNAGQFRDATPVIDEAAGTITFQASYKGLPEKIQTAGGAVLLRDAGVITFADTFNFNTEEFVSSETVVQHGPHPEADSNFTQFCDVISGALA